MNHRTQANDINYRFRVNLRAAIAASGRSVVDVAKDAGVAFTGLYRVINLETELQVGLVTAQAYAYGAGYDLLELLVPVDEFEPKTEKLARA